MEVWPTDPSRDRQASVRGHIADANARICRERAFVTAMIKWLSAPSAWLRLRPRLAIFMTRCVLNHADQAPVITVAGALRF